MKQFRVSFRVLVSDDDIKPEDVWGWFDALHLEDDVDTPNGWSVDEWITLEEPYEEPNSYIGKTWPPGPKEPPRLRGYVWIYAKPGEERRFASPTEPSAERAKAMKEQGYKLFRIDFPLPGGWDGVDQVLYGNTDEFTLARYDAEQATVHALVPITHGVDDE